MNEQRGVGKFSVSPPLVSLRNIGKSFGATRAVADVSFDIQAGQVVGLVGENGAGKSTVAKIIAGMHGPDSGQLVIDGTERNLKSPFEGIRAGIAMMAQEITLVPDRTVEENIFLGDLPHRGPFPNRSEMRRRYVSLVDLTQFDLSPDAKVSSLRIADQQKVEIMRTIAQEAKLVIMDEPSAALTADEVQRLHQSIRKIADAGVAVLLVSHFLDEILEMTNEIVIMRDGELIRVSPTSEETVDSLVSAMVGKALATEYEQTREISSQRVRLEVDGINREGVLHDISFSVRAGEILGLAGLIGSGRSEIARAILGADPKDSGKIWVDEVEVRVRSPRDAIMRGIFMVPENRKEQGLVLISPIYTNLLLASFSRLAKFGVTFVSRMQERARELAKRVDIRFSSISQTAGSLSGGNQQKILFGRAIEANPSVLIVDEPTRGVDIAAKRAIHRVLEERAREGTAVLFISSELDEVLGVCNRILVVNDGRIEAEFRPPYSKEKVVSAFFGKKWEDR